MEKLDYVKLFEKYLDGNASPSELKVLLDWLQSKGFDDWTKKQWNGADQHLSTLTSEKQSEIFERIKLETIDKEENKENKVSSRRSLYIKIAQIAAVALLLVSFSTLSYWYGNGSVSPLNTVVAVNKGEKANIILPDGTIAWLNSSSKISYGKQFDSKQRKVQIEGEVYFEVKKDATRPFIVETKHLDVEVFGTSFNVNTYDEDHLAKVALIEGSVKVVTSKGEPIMLKPNEVVVYNTDLQIAEVSDKGARKEIDWRYNRLRFEGASLESIVNQLERSYNVEIVIKNKTIANRKFTGTFQQNETIEQIFNIMASNNKFSYSIKGNKIEVY